MGDGRDLKIAAPPLASPASLGAGLAAWLVAGCAVAGCAAAPPAEPAASAPSPAPPHRAAAGAAHAGDPSIISVTALDPPKAFVLDGRLDEWASLEAPATPAPVPFVNAWAHRPERRTDITQGPNPRSAASQVAVAIRPGAVLLAASLAPGAADGVWIGVGSAVPALADIGELARGGMTRELNCEFEQLGGPEHGYTNGAPLPPETAAACRKLVERHATLTRAHRARFTRLFRIDRLRIQEVVGDAAVAVDGAQVRAAPRGDGGVTLEVSMPLAALPRLSDAPVSTLRLIARPATLPLPADVETDPWVWVNVPTAVGFEPHADLRALAFKTAARHTFFSAGLSYHPTTPDRLQAVHYPDERTRDRLVSSDALLYEAKRTFGEVEVGTLYACGPWLVIRKQGTPPAVVTVRDLGEVDLDPPPRLEALVERGGALHAVFFTPKPTNGMSRVFAPYWSVIGIAPDGTLNPDLMEVGDDPFQWTEVEERASADWSALTLRGLTHFAGGGGPVEAPTGYEVTYRWNPGDGKYVGRRRRVPFASRIPHTPRPARAPLAPRGGGPKAAPERDD